jgi:hypothetical protein
LLGLCKLRAIGVQRCTLRTDSKVVAGQIEKECITREPTLKRYLTLVRRMENHFKGFTMEYIERSKNTKADELMKAAARNTPLPADVFLQVISDGSIKAVELEPKTINLIQGKDWHAPIMAYLHHYYEPDNTVEHIRMQQRVGSYQIVDNDLYKTSISGPLLQCVSKAEGQEILSEIHAGTCGEHIGARALAAKVLSQGFYWPAVIDDVAKLISTCEACQKFSCNEGPSTVSVANHPIMAPPAVRHRHCRQVNPHTRQLHLRRSGSRILHKMGGSEALNQCKLRINQKVLLAKHHLPLWCTKTHHC